MQTLVIGDIHGCYVELQALLGKAGLGVDDAILAIGDIVDRGPETPQMLAFFPDEAQCPHIDEQPRTATWTPAKMRFRFPCSGGSASLGEPATIWSTSTDEPISP